MQQFNSNTPDQVDGERFGSPGVHEDITSLKDALNQTRTEMSRYRHRMDRRQVEVDAHMRRTNVLWVTTFLFAAGLSAAIWYGFRNKETLVVRFPAVQTLFSGAEGRLSSLEDKLNSWSSVTNGLQDRIAGLEHSPKPVRPENSSGIQRIATEVEARKAELAQLSQLKDENKDINENIRSIQSHLGEVASVQAENREGLSRLNGDVGALRKDFTIVRRDYGDQIDQVQRENAGTIGAVSNLERRLKSSSAEVQLLADSVNRNRIDFEVSRNKTEEVAPGLYLTVRDTNVDRQQIDGFLQIAEDGRFLWFRGQAAQNVMTFNTKRDERNRELIFTHVDKHGVSGYLLIPVSNG